MDEIVRVEEPSWIGLRDRLLKERDRFLQTAPSLRDLVQEVHPEELFDWFSDADIATQEGIVAAVTAFLRDDEWPDLSPNEQAFLLLRLEWAVGMANSMTGCPGMHAPSMDMPEEHILRWFLIEAWDCAGMVQALVGLDLAAQNLQDWLSRPDDPENDDDDDSDG